METATTTLIVLKEFAGNSPPQLNMLQQLLLPHVNEIAMFWTFLWGATAACVLLVLLRAYLTRKD